MRFCSLFILSICLFFARNSSAATANCRQRVTNVWEFLSPDYYHHGRLREIHRLEEMNGQAHPGDINRIYTHIVQHPHARVPLLRIASLDPNISPNGFVPVETKLSLLSELRALQENGRRIMEDQQDHGTLALSFLHKPTWEQIWNFYRFRAKYESLTPRHRAKNKVNFAFDDTFFVPQSPQRIQEFHSAFRKISTTLSSPTHLLLPITLLRSGNVLAESEIGSGTQALDYVISPEELEMYWSIYLGIKPTILKAGFSFEQIQAKAKDLAQAAFAGTDLLTRNEEFFERMKHSDLASEEFDLVVGNEEWPGVTLDIPYRDANDPMNDHDFIFDLIFVPERFLSH